MVLERDVHNAGKEREKEVAAWTREQEKTTTHIISLQKKLGIER